jgi:hypothetical protein
MFKTGMFTLVSACLVFSLLPAHSETQDNSSVTILSDAADLVDPVRAIFSANGSHVAIRLLDVDFNVPLSGCAIALACSNFLYVKTMGINYPT